MALRSDEEKSQWCSRLQTLDSRLATPCLVLNITASLLLVDVDD